MNILPDVIKIIIERGKCALQNPAAQDFHKYISAMIEDLEKINLNVEGEVEMDIGWTSIALLCLQPGSHEVKDKIFEGVLVGLIPAFMIESFAMEMLKRGETEICYHLTKVKDSVKDVVFPKEFGARLTNALLKEEIKNETYRDTAVQ